MNKAIFLDRDGVINKLLSGHVLHSPWVPEDFVLLPGVPDALARLKRAGFILVIVTNQPDIAKGNMQPEDFDQILIKTKELTNHLIDQHYACHHHPDPSQVVVQEYLATCECRKPAPGMILQAQKELDIDLGQSWLVGDSDTDIEAGLAAGIDADRLIKIGPSCTLTRVTVSSLLEAAHHITKEIL